MKKMSKTRFILAIMRDNWKLFITCVITMMAGVGLSYIPPKILGVTVDSVFGELPFDLPQFAVRWLESLGGREYLVQHVWLCGAAVVVVALFSALATFGRTYSAGVLSENLAYKMRRMTFDHIQKLPYAWHKSIKTGDIMQRCSSDINTVCQFVSMQMADVIRIVFMLVTAYVLMFSICFELALASLLFVPVIVFYSGFFFGKIAKQFLVADEAEGALHAVAQENFTGVRVVRAFGREVAELQKFRDANEKFSRLWIRTGHFLALYWSLGDVMSILQMALIVIYGTWLTVNGAMSGGDIFVFVMYGGMLSWPMRRLGRVMGDLSKAGVSIGRICEILDAEPERQRDTVGCPEIRGNIVFDHVSHAYDGRKVLDDVSFEIPVGGSLAILGYTGSGKSTLVHLINRLYELGPDCGSIRIDGTDVRDIDLRHLRKNVGIVLQEPFLFSDTLEKNLRLAAPDLSEEQMHAVTQTAAVHETIMGFEHGYDTIVGEKGVTLSGGQRQRVAIARTLAQNTPILIFDDSLSAVDVQTDSMIRSALKRREQKATTILIAHRISTLMDADRILVLSNGKVAEYGTHEELLARDGIYKGIYNIQSRFEEELEDEAASSEEGGACNG